MCCCPPSVAYRPLAIALVILLEGSTGCAIAALTVDDSLASTSLFVITMGAAAIALLALIGVVVVDPGVTTAEREFEAGAEEVEASSESPIEKHSEPVVVDVNHQGGGGGGEPSFSANVLHEIPTREVTLSDGSRVKQRWCRTCLLWRNPGVSHCSVCGYCMEGFDHHCGVVDTCIARGNHRFFVALLLFGAVGSSSSLVAAAMSLNEEKFPLAGWTNWETVPTFLLACVYAYTSILVGPFGCFHCSLLLRNTTTKQLIKRKDAPKSKQGACSCVIRICFAPVKIRKARARENV